jgi:hypothetical protein
MYWGCSVLKCILFIILYLLYLKMYFIIICNNENKTILVARIEFYLPHI